MTGRGNATGRVRCGAGGALALMVLGFAAPVSAGQPADDGQWWHIQWRMEEVWQVTDGSGVTVAVLDTGVEASIPELSGAVVPGADFAGAGGDGTVDQDQTEGSHSGHGTAMASLIAGDGGAGGFRGVAPGTTILPVVSLVDPAVSFSDPGSGSLTVSLPPAIRYAVDEGAQVINISLGGAAECPQQVAEAVRYAVSQDVIILASGGNLAEGLGEFPANCPGVLAVAATDRQLDPWEHSHRNEYIDLSAPGTLVSGIPRNGQVNIANGTSIATALAAGAIALVRAQFPDASADEVLARVFTTMLDLGPDGKDDATGYGIVRPYQAVTEPVPAEASHPFFNDLGELTDDSDEPAAALSPGTAERPEVGLGPPSDDSGLPWGLVTTGVVALLVLTVATVLLLARSRSTRLRDTRQPTGDVDE